IGLFTVFEIILLLFAGALLTRLIDRIKLFVSTRNIKKTLPVLLAGLKVFLWIIILFSIISLFITQTDELIAALFLIGLILLGVAAIPFLRNLVGGFYISLSKPFEIGDYISVKSYSGEITEIGWRSTIIVTEERSFVNIPNSVFLFDAVENVNVGQKEQLVSLNYEFPIDYDNNLIIKILRESAISSPFLFGRKEPSVLLENTDYIKRINKYKLNLYIFDSKFENEMIHSINQAILAAVKNKIELIKDNVSE
ncbi:MAG: mechanosensitive ion channel family protein, partial [Ignavibacteriaceae bacterium]|nr:mechanosensitive ion channel family protein [Ignavibacteriaceae bacterium]